jgi:hypothetical protein
MQTASVPLRIARKLVSPVLVATAAISCEASSLMS